MTHAVRTIARLDAHHSVALCSHDALHLNWGPVSIHIPQLHFVALARLLEHIQLGRTQQEFANSVARIWQDRHGHIQLRLGECALYFQPNDFLQFVSLVEETLLVLGHELPAAQAGLPTRPAIASNTLWTNSRYRASLN